MNTLIDIISAAIGFVVLLGMLVLFMWVGYWAWLNPPAWVLS